MTKKALIVVLSVVCALCLGLLTLTACGAKLDKIEITTPPAKVEYVEGDKLDVTGLKVSAVYSNDAKEEVTDYTLSIANGTELKTTDTKLTVTYQEKTAEIALTVKAKTLTFNGNVTLGTQVKVEARGEKVYYVISDCTYDATVIGYDLAAEKDAFTSQIAEKIYFDLQQNSYVQTGSWENGHWDLAIDNTHTVNITESGKFEVAVDITELDEYCYTTHCDTDDHPNMNGEERNHDFKPNTESYSNKVVIGDKKYTIVFVKDGNDSNFWGCIGLKITDASAKSYTTDPVSLELKDNKVYLVISGTVDNYTEEEFKAAITAFDVEKSTWNGKYGSVEDLIISVDTEKETFTVKYDVTDLEVVDGGNGGYLCHFNGGDVGNEKGIDEITCGSKTYSYKFHDFNGWTRYILTIKDVPAAE